MLFDTIETVVNLMRRAATSTGLRTTVNVIRRSYETGRNATDEVKLPAQRAGHLGANHQTSRVVAGSFFLADDSEYTA